MNESQYLQKHFPKDFIKIGYEIFILPVGFEISIDKNEIGNTLTTADGTKRKDIISKNEKATLKYDKTTQAGFETLQTITEQIEDADFQTEKTLFLKKENMINTNNIYSDFKIIKIDVVDCSKYTYKFRRNGMFIYSGITLKIN